MRDLARHSGMSLSGMYYYFESKERLLYLIQKYTFTTRVERLRERLKQESDPERRIHAFILNHLQYFPANQKAMNALSHEDEALKHGFGAELARLTPDDYRIRLCLLADPNRARTL